MLKNIMELKNLFMDTLIRFEYSQTCCRNTERLFDRLMSFMDDRECISYSEEIGNAFLCQLQEEGLSDKYCSESRTFIYRLNALLHENPFPFRRSLHILPDIPNEFSSFLDAYRVERKKNGMKDSSINLNVRIFHLYFEKLAESGCKSFVELSPEKVSKATLSMLYISYLEKIRTLFHYLFHHRYINRDYSYAVPVPKRPQLIPDVYSVPEIQEIEAGAKENPRTGKRDFAALLLATRYGLRGGDISRIKTCSFDFENDCITIEQQKTDTPLVLPLIPEVKNAVLDYINSERKVSNDPFLFLSSMPPFGHISVQKMDQIVKQAIVRSKIQTNGRGCGPRSFRSSLASSMVNDGVSYEVVRKALGHTDQNAIKHYARLDIDRLSIYALRVPEATGCFADFLNGKAGD